MITHYKPTTENIGDYVADTRDTLCYATNDNQSAVQGMLETDADIAIVIGGYNSSNTSHLVELCEIKLPTYFIKDENCLISGSVIKHFDLHTHTEIETNNYLPSKRPLRVMITSGASCPDALVERVMERLAELTGNTDALQQASAEWI
jgi:4-hydroxy-3-methylbut-2-enyl diphosphate reductase